MASSLNAESVGSVFDLELTRHAQEGVRSSIAHVGRLLGLTGHGRFDRRGIGPLGDEADDGVAPRVCHLDRRAQALGIDPVLLG